MMGRRKRDLCHNYLQDGASVLSNNPVCAVMGEKVLDQSLRHRKEVNASNQVTCNWERTSG